MTLLGVGILFGGCLGVIVMGLLAGDTYRRGGDDALEALARRRRAKGSDDRSSDWRHA
jgi:hypothetical protein